MRPNDRKYAQSHEWVKLDGDVAIIGITDFAVQELSNGNESESPAHSNETSLVSVPEFQGDSAMAWVERQVAFGPRIIDSQSTRR